MGEKDEDGDGSQWGFWIIVIAFRVLQGLLVCTYFNPDEFWQAHEVAHKMAFHCGELTWEWSRQWRLRSPLHPLIFAAVYRILAMFNMDTRDAIVFSPRVLQSVAAAWCDYSMHSIAVRVFGPNSARWALLCQLTNWFNGFCLVRPFSSSLEAVLTVTAFDLFLASGCRLHASWLSIAGVACVIRPTNAVVWIAPGVYALIRIARVGLEGLVRAIGVTIMIGAVSIAMAVAIDSLFYQTFTWTAVEFFYFNVAAGGSSLYGVHHAFWYVTEGLPAVVGTMMPLLFWARRGWASSEAFVMLATIVLTVITLSLNPHKEFRFLLPVLPFFMILVGEGFWQLITRRPFVRVPLALVVGISNTAAFWYLGRVHQHAPMSCVDWLAKVANGQPNHFSIDFLTSCHATPFHAHLHRPSVPCADIRFLDCSPQWQEGALTRSFTDSAELAAKGSVFVEAYYRRSGSRWPRFVVMFEESVANLSSALPGYSQAARFDHNVEGSSALVVFERPVMN